MVLKGISSRAELLSKIEDFLGETELSATRFGYLTTGDPSLVTKLRKGGDIRLQTAERILLFIAENEILRSKTKKSA
jgi:predicted transcriptional regulator